MNTKKTIVFLSGLLSDAYLWQHQTKHLQSHAEIILPDLSQCTDLASCLNTIFDEIPCMSFHLVGHGMGGWLAMEVATLFPRRINKLALLSTTAASESEQQKLHYGRLIQQYQAGRQQEVLDQLVSERVYQRSKMPTIYEMFQRNSECFLRQMKMLLKREDKHKALARIHCPSLIVYSRFDSLSSVQDAEDMTAHLPRSHQVCVEDSGHMLPIECPQAVTALLAYWLQ